MKKLTVMKFGGTSVSHDEKIEKISMIIKDKLQNEEQVVVVISAMGRYPENYATDTLLSKIDDKYKEAAQHLVDYLVTLDNVELNWGSCSVSIMGICYDTFLKHNKKIKTL